MTLVTRSGWSVVCVGSEGVESVSAQSVEETWELKAACRGPHAGVFFPPSYTERKDEKNERESRAKAICRACGVREECLQYALSIREAHGIWGGLNEQERRQLLAKRGL